jgi:hypothetical protein
MFYRKENHSSRLLQAVAKMKWHQRDVFEMTEECSQPCFFLGLRPRLVYPIPSSDKHTQQRKFYNFKYLK